MCAVNLIKCKGLKNNFKKFRIKNHLNNKILKRKTFFFIKYQKINFFKIQTLKINFFLKYPLVGCLVVSIRSNNLHHKKLKNNFFKKMIMFINLYFY